MTTAHFREIAECCCFAFPLCKLPVWRFSKWLCPTAAGKSADIGCEGKKSARSPGYILDEAGSIAGCSGKYIHVMQFPTPDVPIWPGKLGMKSTINYILQHVIPCNYVMISESTWVIIRLFIVTNVVKPLANMIASHFVSFLWFVITTTFIPLQIIRLFLFLKCAA